MKEKHRRNRIEDVDEKAEEEDEGVKVRKRKTTMTEMKCRMRKHFLICRYVSDDRPHAVVGTHL